MATTAMEQPPLQQTLDRDAIQGFREQLGGHVLLASDPGYDDARKIWNQMIDKRPALIVRPSGVADVRQAVAFAREQGLGFSIKGGGHNVAGHAVSEGGLMLDMGSMRSVQVNPRTRRARAEGGATWADFDREAGAFGLATTAGVISTTGVAGLTLGGGVGWLIGKHGLSIDNLLSVDLVTADGEFVTASADEHPDLFWALRGGGGNFGVATCFEFQLHPHPEVLAGFTAHPVADARAVLNYYRELTMDGPDELTVYAEISTDPESGERVIALGFCWSGDMAEGERVLAPVMAFGSPVAQMIEPMPFPVWQSAYDEQFPFGRRYFWKGSMLRDLPDAFFDAMIEYAADPPIPSTVAALEGYGGAMNRVAPDATAFAHRDARYQLVIVGSCDDPVDDEKAIAWARSLHKATEQFSTNAAFLNFNSLDGGDSADYSARVRAGYGPNLSRLVDVKRRYDPTNFFRENNNIAP